MDATKYLKKNIPLSSMITPQHHISKKKYHIIPSEKPPFKMIFLLFQGVGIWPCFQEKVHSNKRETWNPFHLLSCSPSPGGHRRPWKIFVSLGGTLGTDGNRKSVPRRGGTAAEHRWQHLHFRWMCRLVQKCRGGFSVNEGECFGWSDAVNIPKPSVQYLV